MKERLVEIGRDSAWYLSSNVAVAVIGFVSLPILTRIFPPRDYGIFSLVNTAIALGAPILYAWLTNSIIRFYPEHEDRGELDVFYSTVFNIIPYYLVFFLAVLLPVAALVLPLGEYRLLVCLGIAVFALLVLFQAAAALMRARQLAWQYALLTVFVTFGRYVAGAGIAVWLGQGVRGPFWGWLGALTIAIPVELLFLKSHRYYSRKKGSRDLRRAFFGYGFALIFVTFLAEVLSASDRYMLQAFKGAQQVGLYSMVYTLVTNSLGIISVVVTLAAAPVITQVYEREGEGRAVSLVGKITRYFLILMMPAMTGIWVLRDPITRVVTSSRYVPAEPAYLPIAAGIAFFYISWLPATAFMLKKRTRLTLVPMGTAAAANIVLNLLLIPRYGFPGAAWATFISYLGYMVILVSISRTHMPWEFPWKAALKTAVATGAMAAVLYGLIQTGIHGIWGLAALVSAGTVAYSVTLLLLGGFTRAELAFALQVLERTPGIRTAMDAVRGTRRKD